MNPRIINTEDDTFIVRKNSKIQMSAIPKTAPFNKYTGPNVVVNRITNATNALNNLVFNN